MTRHRVDRPAFLALVVLLAFRAGLPEGAPAIRPEAAAEAERQRRAVERVEKLSAEIEGAVARLRGLPFKQPVHKGLKSRPELRDYVAKLMARKQPKERLDATSRALAMLGLFPRDFDLQECVLDLLEEQVAGLYDPEAKALFLTRGWSLARHTIISHELTHALQDQHFDLQSMPMEDETREDLANAIRCVVEGEATLIMMYYVSEAKLGRLGPLEKLMGIGYGSFLEQVRRGHVSVDQLRDRTNNWMTGSKKVDSAPTVLRECLVLPYFQGLVFVHTALRRGGWGAVNSIYSDLPQSTEQVLHPKKYFVDRDRPTVIDVPDPHSLAPKGFQLIFRSVLGELYLAVLMRDLLGKSAPRAAWEGWDGDHFLAYHRPDEDRGFFVWATVWDSEWDAREFMAAHQRIELHRARPAADGGTVEEPRALYLVQRREAEVLIVRGQLPRKELERVAKKVWATRELREAGTVNAKGPSVAKPPPGP